MTRQTAFMTFQRELPGGRVEVVETYCSLGETIYVTRGSCTECLLTPDRVISSGETRELVQECLAYHHFPECHCIAAARLRGGFVPEYVCCYGFYYMHWHENQFLREATESREIQFLDISDLPSLRESNLLVIRGSDGKCWYSPPYPIRNHTSS